MTSIEYLGEKTFLEEVASAGEVWVARGPNKNIYAQEIENFAYSLPAWSSREKVLAFLQITHLEGRFAPHAIPLEEFTGRWLSDQSLHITEVQVNPSGKSSRVLALTTEEVQTRLAPA